MSIRIKIFAYLLIFCALLIGLLWLFQVVFLDDIYKTIKIAEIKSDMNLLVDNIENDDIAQIALNIAGSQDINVEIFDARGLIIFGANGTGQTRTRVSDLEKTRMYLMAVENNGEYLEYPNDRETAQPNTPMGVILTASFMQQRIQYCKIVSAASGASYTIFLEAIISPVNATVNTLQIELLFITGFMIVFSVVIALLIARRVSKPIVSLNNSAKILAAGRYDVHFTGKGYKEISELSNTLNYTANELTKVEALRRELIANISHDLRTPLTMIAGYAEAMRDLPGENNAENAQIIVDEAKHLSLLVNDVLDISRLQSGVQQLLPEVFDVTQSIRQMIERMAELIKNTGVSIVFENDGPAFVEADPIKLMQAFYNLLTNAINFVGEDKKVLVRQTQTADGLLVEIIDCGKGIAQEELPYIWDRYYRTGELHKRSVVGTGIGLSIVKSILELHGAQYGVISSVGQGSNFWFRLPRM